MESAKGDPHVERGWQGRADLFPLIAILIAVLATDAGSKLLFTWKNANYTGGSFKNVLVLAINGSATARADFEDRMVKEMSRPGVTVVQSCTLMPRPNATPINLNDLRGYVRELIWSGTTDTVDPRSTTSAVDSIVKLLVRHFEKDKLI